MIRLAAVALILSFVSGFQKPADLAKGTYAPDFSAKTLSGDSFHLAAQRGSIVFVDFWASWCLPCRKQNISLVKIQEKYRLTAKRKGVPLVFISISMDTNRDLWSVAVSKDNLNWKRQICDLAGWDSPLAKSYRVKKLPTSFLIDREGKIIAKDIWGDELDGMLEKTYNDLSN